MEKCDDERQVTSYCMTQPYAQHVNLHMHGSDWSIQGRGQSQLLCLCNVGLQIVYLGLVFGRSV